MNSLYFNRPHILWKISGILMVALIVFFSSIIKGGFFEQYHSEIMRWSFLLVILLCGLLFHDFLNILRLQQEQIEGLMGIKLALTSLIDLKDHYTEGHSRSVRDIARRFAEHLKLSQKDVEEITVAAELHDIGKIGVPDSILKKTGKLNEQEFCEIKKHPARGADSVQLLRGFEKIEKIVRHHHEKFDGTGYPDGLSNGQIPLGSKIISIVDAYDAMIHARSYRKAIAKNKVIEIMEKEKGDHFDPELLSVFINFIKIKNHRLQYDPVCGMSVNKKNASNTSTYHDKIYMFCSKTCLQKFTRSPGKYAV